MPLNTLISLWVLLLLLLPLKKNKLPTCFDFFSYKIIVYSVRSLKNVLPKKKKVFF